MRGKKVPKRHKKPSAKDIAEVLSGKLNIKIIKIPKKARLLIRKILSLGEYTDEAAPGALMYETKVPVGNGGAVAISLYNGKDTSNGFGKCGPMLEVSFEDGGTPLHWKKLDALPDFVEFPPQETGHSVCYRVLFED